MPRFRRRPQPPPEPREIEARVWDGTEEGARELIEWLGDDALSRPNTRSIEIRCMLGTRANRVHAYPGDYVTEEPNVLDGELGATHGVVRGHLLHDLYEQVEEATV